MRRKRRCLTACGLVALLFVGWPGLACDDYLGGPPTDGGAELIGDGQPGDLRPGELSRPEPSRELTSDDSGPRRSVHVPYRQTWYGGAVMYQIFPRSFQDSDGDGIGDLNGITQRLDYLKAKGQRDDDLQVAGIWLTPIFKSGSYHGYDTVDYMSIDPAYGSLDDFKTLLKEAHARGLKVILDLVLNHSSRAHPWFKDSSAGPDAAKRQWYVWRSDDPKWSHPFTAGRSPWAPLGNFFYYAIFSPGMPDLNLAHPPVQAEIKKIMAHWLALGVDGFRFDAIRYLLAPSEEQQADAPATHALIKSLLADARKQYPKALFVGEAWTTTQAVARYFGDGDELDLCFQFDLVDAVDRAFQRGRASSVRTALAESIKHLREPAFHAPILGNHDHKRLMSRLLHQESAAKLAAVLLLTLPGTPFVYYGEEIGMGNANNEGDISKRAPMQWDDTTKAGFSKGIPWARLYGKQDSASVAIQASQPDSLLSLYKKLIRARAGHDALRHGDLTLLDLQGHDGAATTSGLAFARYDKGTRQRAVVVLNFSETEVLKVALPADAFGGAKPSSAQELLQPATLPLSQGSDGSWALPDLPPHGALVLIVGTKKSG